MPTTTKKPFWRSRWWMPACSLFLGLLLLAASWIGDDLSGGLQGLGVMAAVGAVFLIFGSRSDTLSGLGGPRRDERWEAIDMRATAFAGMVLVTCVIGGWLLELAQGRDGEPYVQLGAIGGVAYILAIAYLRWRG
jgi:hypothetical protein